MTVCKKLYKIKIDKVLVWSVKVVRKFVFIWGDIGNGWLCGGEELVFVKCVVFGM